MASPSPFPGMDPYLQGRWADVHAKLIAYIGEALTPLLPRDLRARSEERILLESIEGETLRRYRGDVAVVEAGVASARGLSVAAASGAATITPVIVEFSDESYVDRFVQIVDIANGGRVVTAVQVLSPWNKAAGRLNDDYLRKVNDYARAAVSVVEIDLLRGSRARMIVTADDLPPDRRSAYSVCVRRGWLGHRWEVFPIPLRQRLPAIPIPLRQSDSDVLLELQPLIDRVYIAGGHDDINYEEPLDPPLDHAETAWVAELIRTAPRS
jgi:hypothetical protein